MGNHPSCLDGQLEEQVVFVGGGAGRPAGRGVGRSRWSGPPTHRVRPTRARGPPPFAQGRPDPGHQLAGRKGLEDVIGSPRLEGLGNDLAAAVAGREDDGQVGYCPGQAGWRGNPRWNHQAGGGKVPGDSKCLRGRGDIPGLTPSAPYRRPRRCSYPANVLQAIRAYDARSPAGEGQ